MGLEPSAEHPPRAQHYGAEIRQQGPVHLAQHQALAKRPLVAILAFDPCRREPLGDLFYLGDRVFGLGHPQLQTLMYLMLSVAGHLTIFLTRTRGPVWSIRPARILLIAVLGTQTLATLIAVYGIFMTPLGWKWAAFVWGYALVWFLLSDRIKLLAYSILDPTKTAVALTVAAFHTDTDPGDPVYHDTSQCPYGQEIIANGNDHPGTDDRRRCDWCAAHANTGTPAAATRKAPS